MNILFISESLRKGGKERQLQELIVNLNDHGHRVSLILFDSNIAYPKILQWDINLIVLDKKGFNKLITPVRLLKIVRKTKPDVIHSWSPILTIFSSLASFLYAIPIVDSIRYAKEINFFSKTWFVRNISFSISNIVVANSKAGLKTHNKHISSKYKVIYNGFDFKRNENIFSKDQIKQHLGINFRFIVGMVANFYPGKDYLTLINAAKKVIESKIDVGFVLVGEGPDRKTIEDSIGKHKSFYFMGTRDDVEDIVKTFDIGVLLSNTKHSAEGISNAILEIMSTGTPVIATNSGGNPEIIEDGIDGILIEPFDEFSLVEQLNKLIEDEKKRIQMGEKAQNKIATKFPIEKMITSYEKLYLSLQRKTN